jgi:diacylglycerol kinase family enzyme
MGTGNDFAAGLDVPDDPAEAARACLDGQRRRLDLLATDDGEVVVNAAHAGLGAVASDRAQAVKPVAGPLAYPLAALASGAAHEPYDLEVTVDDEVVHDGPALLVLAANGPCLGGGARLCVGADPADGLLDVLVIDALAVSARAGLAMAIQRGTHLQRSDVHTHRGTRLRLRGEAVDHSRDGELRHDVTDAIYRIRPAAWDLLLR